MSDATVNKQTCDIDPQILKSSDIDICKARDAIPILYSLATDRTLEVH